MLDPSDDNMKFRVTVNMGGGSGQVAIAINREE